MQNPFSTSALVGIAIVLTSGNHPASAQAPVERVPPPKPVEVVPAPKPAHVLPNGRLTPENLPRFLDAVRLGYQLPALGVAIVNRGRISVFTSGVRKMGDPTPVTNEDSWALGSCTKSMTALLIATFVEAGELKWDSTVSEMLPDLAEVMRPEYRAVTLRQLLTHRAGFRIATVPLDGSFKTGDGWSVWAAKKEPVQEQRTAYVKWFLTHKPAYPPGTKIIYSNVGYMIAGAAIERLSGKSWEEIIRERVFEPLGLGSARFGTQNTAEPLEPWPHFERDGETFVASPDLEAPGHSVEHPSMEFPAVSGPYGTVRISLVDWAKYAQFWLDGLNGQCKLISPQSFEVLTTAPDDLDDGDKSNGAYASGWKLYHRAWSKGTVLKHDGTNSKNNAVIWLAPKENFAVMVVANRDHAEPALDDVAAPLVTELFRLSQLADKAR